jgi:hypothetical protein
MPPSALPPPPPRSRCPRPPISTPAPPGWSVWACRKTAAPTGQFRVCRKFPPAIATGESRRPPQPPSAPVPIPLTPLTSPVPLALSRQLAGPPGAPPPPAWAGRPAPTVPPTPRPGAPPPRTQDAGTRGEGMPGRSRQGPSAWPGPSRLVVPLPTRPLRLGRRRSPPPSRAPLARWLLASLHTLRPHLGREMPRKPEMTQKTFLGTRFTMEVARARLFPHTKWACFWQIFAHFLDIVKKNRFLLAPRLETPPARRSRDANAVPSG